jgi:microcystin degradation protein MlrC
MRVAVGGVYHESNTFIPRPTSFERFAEKDLHFGTEILDHWTNTCSEMGGFLKGAADFGFDVLPTLMAWGMPSGPLTSEAFERLSSELTARVEASFPLDGVLLSLHGAMVAENFLDADGEILRRVRKALGPRIPLVVTLDFHANVTEGMARWPDAIIGYDTYPHIDQAERGFEAADVLRRILRGDLRPKIAFARRPLLPHILRQVTELPPMADAIRSARELERRPEVVVASVFAGFPYADVPDAGLSVVVVTENRPEMAHDLANQLADSIWARRAEFNASIPLVDEAVRRAISENRGLTVLVDIGDNLGAGTPGDGTVILAELLRQRAGNALVLLADPEAVIQCIKVGVRERIRLKVGAKSDPFHGESLEIEGWVRTLSDGVFRNIGPMRDGLIDDQGRTAVVETSGIVIVLTERRMPMWNLQQLRALGIEPGRLSIIVVKAAIAYRAAYASIAHQIIEVDTPGLSTADVRRLQYNRLQRPVFPLDPI